MRVKLAQAFLATFFSLAPSSLPMWRTDPSLRPVAELAIGEPVQDINAMRLQRRREHPFGA